MPIISKVTPYPADDEVWVEIEGDGGRVVYVVKHLFRWRDRVEVMRIVHRKGLDRPVRLRLYNTTPGRRVENAAKLAMAMCLFPGK